MDWFWHTLLVCVIVIPVTVMWIAIVVEIFRRRDLSGLARITWLALILVLPLVGSLAYVGVTWWRAKDGHDMAVSARDEVSARPSSVSDLTRLDQLRRAGVLTEDEFDRGKRRVLEGADGPHGRHASEGVGS